MSHPVKEVVLQSTPQRRHEQDWDLTTAAANADQVIGSFTPTNGYLYVVQAIFVESMFSVISAVATILGTVSIRWKGVKIHTSTAVNPTSSAPFGYWVPIPEEGMVLVGANDGPFDAVCTPTGVASMLWRVTVFGYERMKAI